MLPTYPANLLPRPFADNGTFQVIPDNKAAEGRASFKEGFPVETQLPLSSGGIAPSRPDFNGILYMLSAMAFWQQSGGQWVYNAELDYNTPAIVFHNGVLWWCKTPNGPSQTIGAVTPGTNTDYWITLLDFLAGASGGDSVTFGNPVGTVIMFYGTTAPEGYLTCDGGSFSATDYPKLFALLGRAATPDFRGLVPRSYDPTASRDPDGATRAIGSIQQDAMQPITGTMGGMPLKVGLKVDTTTFTGALYKAQTWGQSYTDAGGRDVGISLGINSATVTRTANETRGKNFSILFAIRHD